MTNAWLYRERRPEMTVPGEEKIPSEYLPLPLPLLQVTVISMLGNKRSDRPIFRQF